MESLTRTAAIDGPEPFLVDVECSVTSGFAGLQLVGNTSEVCRDGKERAKTALEKLGFKLSHKRILINLAPADTRKEGNHFDLPIAVSLASLARQEPMANKPSDWLFAAELSLDGALRPSRAIVPMTLTALRSGLKGLVLAKSHASDLAILEALPLVKDRLKFYFFEHLGELLEWLFEGKDPLVQSAEPSTHPAPTARLNFDDMNLTPELQRLAVVCAVGKHSLLLRGSPGSGKSMFAHRLPSLIPKLSPEQQLETLQVYSLIHQNLPGHVLRGEAPFRNPHHSASPQALLGTAFEPGELALAHGGILFLDELPEFRRDLLESLREPLELGLIHISRAQKKVYWRTSLQFIAACNNCPCGWSGSRKRVCRCSTPKLLQYWGKLSGPILDRIDIHFNMPELDQASEGSFLIREKSLTTSPTASLRRQVELSLEFAQTRFEKLGVGYNSALKSEQLQESCSRTTRDFQDLLQHLERFRLSNRALVRCLKVARTLADLDLSQSVSIKHVEEAANWQQAAAALERGENFPELR